MNENILLFSGKVLSLYSQVALFDAEDKEAYPQWKTGDEIVVFGLHGVAVVTAGDKQVDVRVFKGMVEPQHSLCVSGEIEIGEQGVLVGNVPAASVTHLSLSSGKYSVVVYTDKVGPETEQVVFCIDRLN